MTAVVDMAGPSVVAPPGQRRVYRLRWQGYLGFVLLAVMLLVGLLGPLIAPHSPTAVAVGPTASGPTSANLLGADALGRDVLSRVLTGGIGILLVAAAGVTIAYLLGIAIGFFAALEGGWIDTVVAGGLDILISLPYLLVAFVAVALFGTSDLVIILLLAAVFLPYTTRVARAVAREIASRDFVQLAVCRGESRSTLIFREVLPNASGPLLADYGQQLTFGVLTMTTFSYLGLGANPPESNWGLMIAEGQPILQTAPLAALAPAACVALLCLGLNLVADSYREQLTQEADPRIGGMAR